MTWLEIIVFQTSRIHVSNVFSTDLYWNQRLTKSYYIYIYIWCRLFSVHGSSSFPRRFASVRSRWYQWRLQATSWKVCCTVLRTWVQHLNLFYAWYINARVCRLCRTNCLFCQYAIYIIRTNWIEWMTTCKSLHAKQFGHGSLTTYIYSIYNVYMYMYSL